MALLLSRLGAFSHRHRAAVVLVWLLLLVGGGVGAGTLAGETSDSFAIPGQESTTALERISEEFGAAGGATAQVVVAAPEGRTLTTPESAAAIGALVTELDELPGVASASNPLDPAAPSVNAELTTGYSTVTYGSLVVAGLNLLTALVGVGIGVLGITIATGFTDLSSTTPILAAMLGLAVGIDYALFIVSRFRQELRSGADVGTAVATAVGTAGSAVVTAGLTVVIALTGLFVAGIPFLTQMGLAAAGTIVVAVLVALTLVPAVLGWLGPRALPRRQRTALASGPLHEPAHARRAGFLAGWVGTVTRFRVVSLLLAVIALGVVAVPAFSMETTLVQAQPEGTTQARADRLIT